MESKVVVFVSQDVAVGGEKGKGWRHIWMNACGQPFDEANML
jgi:hypothetical protein